MKTKKMGFIILIFSVITLLLNLLINNDGNNNKLVVYEYNNNSNSVVDSKIERVTLRHIIHLGTFRYPNLVRRLDLNNSQVRFHELTAGISFTYNVSVMNGVGVKPVRHDAIKEFQ